MTDAQKYELWQYTEIGSLRENMSVVRNDYSGQLMVLRTCQRDRYPVLSRLCGMADKNLMRIYDVVDDGVHCLSLGEYIEGTTLEQLIRTEGARNEQQTREIAVGVCSGLDALHRLGIIHKDIKPSNVMLDREGVVKIIDYDIMRICKTGAEKDTALFGTAGYASPEHFGFGQTDPRSDIYSVGVLMNYLLTGELPDHQLYSGSLTPVIRRCLEVDAEKRYDSVEQLRSVLLGRLPADAEASLKERKNRPFRPLPGFRGKRLFPKIVTGLLLAAYVVLLCAVIDMHVKEIRSGNRLFWEHLYFSADFLVFLTALPYLLFGDVFYLSEKLCPSNPARGRTLTRVLGVLSLSVGVIMTFVYQYIPFS